MNDHYKYKGKKVYLTDDEQAEKDARDAIIPKPIIIKKDPFKETVIELLQGLTGKTRKQIDKMIEDKKNS